MNRPHGNRARLGGVLLAAVAAIAVLALPGLASSHDRHHDHPGDAGTIQSFDPETGVLTIDLANGGSVSGLVVTRTRIRCGGGHGHGHDLRHPRRAHGAGVSRRGGGEVENESNHQGRGEDPPGHDGTPPGNSEGPGQGAEHSARCTIDDLVAGATVKIAELVLIDGSALYRLVGLAEHAPEGEPEPAPAI